MVVVSDLPAECLYTSMLPATRLTAKQLESKRVKNRAHGKRERERPRERGRPFLSALE